MLSSRRVALGRLEHCLGQHPALGQRALAIGELQVVLRQRLDTAITGDRADLDEMVGHDLDQAKRVRILRERGFDVSLDQE